MGGQGGPGTWAGCRQENGGVGGPPLGRCKDEEHRGPPSWRLCERVAMGENSVCVCVCVCVCVLDGDHERLRQGNGHGKVADDSSGMAWGQAISLGRNRHDGQVRLAQFNPAYSVPVPMTWTLLLLCRSG